jgi:hypothetical protein
MNATEGRIRCRHQRSHRGYVGNIAMLGDDLATGRLDLRNDAFKRKDVAQADFRAFGGQALSIGGADTLGCASDNRNLSRKSTQYSSPLNDWRLRRRL